MFNIYLSVNIWKKLKKLLLRMRWESSKCACVDESANVGVDQNGARSFEIHLYTSSVPLHWTYEYSSALSLKLVAK